MHHVSFHDSPIIGNSSHYVGELDLEYMVGLQFEMAPGDPWIGNFYLKKTLNIFYLSVLKYTLQYIGDIFSHYGFQ